MDMFQVLDTLKECYHGFYTDVLAHFDDTLLTKASHFIEDVKKQYKVKSNGVVLKQFVFMWGGGDKGNSVCPWCDESQIPSAKDILNAMDYMETKNKHVAFIVASDTTDWCKQHLHKT